MSEGRVGWARLPWVKEAVVARCPDPCGASFRIETGEPRGRRRNRYMEHGRVAHRDLDVRARSLLADRILRSETAG